MSSTILKIASNCPRKTVIAVFNEQLKGLGKVNKMFCNAARPAAKALRKYCDKLQ